MPVGTPVRVVNITDPNDAELNGREGRLCTPFIGYSVGDVGIRLTANEKGHEENINVMIGEFEVIAH